jgi:hypothetical protein
MAVLTSQELFIESARWPFFKRVVFMPVHEPSRQPPLSKPQPQSRPLRSVIVAAAMAVGLASCSKEENYTDQQRSCIVQRYTNYDARQLSQCVDVCRACMNGNIVTCNTSCRLKGAS